MKISHFLFFGPALLVLGSNSWAADRHRLDDGARAKVLAALRSKISAEYVFPDKAKLIVERLNAKEKSGAYRDIDDLEQLAAALTRDLQQPSRDLHLDVAYSASPMSDALDSPARKAELDRAFEKSLMAENFGIRKVEILPSNIGYIDLRSFDYLPLSKGAIGAAMALVAHTDALIVDLRNNNGGDPDTVAFMSSYLFDQPTHLNDLYWRQGNRRVAFWTKTNVPGKKFGGSKKIYVLTSAKTFSAAEEFSYNLKQLKRAVIVGETTAGGAHPGRGHQLHPHLSVFIPNGRAINPISKTNWEGTGVVPDVQATAADAPRTAERLALQDLLQSPTDDDRAQSLRKRLGELER